MPRLSKQWTLLCLLAAGAGLLAGCDAFQQVPFDPEYVVEAYLSAGEELPAIRLSRTAEVDTRFIFEEQALNNAEVAVMLIGQQGGPEATFPYRESTFRPGVYLPEESTVVRGGRTYALEVVLSRTGDTLRSQTTVPEPLLLTYVSADTLVYQGEAQLEVDIATTADEVGERIFVFTAEALEPDSTNLTPFTRAIFETGDLTLADLATSSSPLLNEANYNAVGEKTVRIKLPWLAISFYGPNRLSIASVDRNYYDFRRTKDIQQGGSTLSPGEIPDILDHIDGGTGIFASFARVSTELYVERPETSE